MSLLASIVMSVHNEEAYLPQVLESLFAQTFRDFEAVVIDDASTDDTAQILKRAAREDSRIRVFTNPESLRLTRSLNRALGCARGKWIVRQDGDDISHPERLACQIRYMQEHPEVSVLGTRYEAVDEEGRELQGRELPLGDTEIRWEMLFQNPFIHSSVCFPRLDPAGNPVRYDESFTCSQDYRMWQLLLRWGKGVNLPEKRIKFRQRNGSISRLRKQEQQDMALRVIMQEWQHLNFPQERESGILQQLRGWYLEFPDTIHRADLKTCETYMRGLRLFNASQSDYSESWRKRRSGLVTRALRSLPFKKFYRSEEYYRIWMDCLLMEPVESFRTLANQELPHA